MTLDLKKKLGQVFGLEIMRQNGPLKAFMMGDLFGFRRLQRPIGALFLNLK
jgi:hypothetical protein